MENGGNQSTRRLKLSFDANSFKATDDFPLKTLVLVPGTLKNVSDLCYHILTKFDLKKECPNGLSLSIEGFSVPPTQEVSIVRENDVITVHKRTSAESKKRPIETSKPPKHTVKKHKVVPTPAPVKPVKPTHEGSSSSSESSLSGEGYSSESETSSEDESSEDSSSEDEKVKKSIIPTQKSLVIPTKVAPSQPKKVVELPKPKPPTPQQKPQQTVTTPNKEKAVVTPTKTTPPPTKGYVKFDENGNQMQTTPTTQSAPVTPVTDSKTKRKRNKKNKTPTNAGIEDVQKNSSVVLTNAAQAKPERNYASFPLLNPKEMPKVGDHIAFNMVELIGWQPTVSLKEADVLDINQNSLTLKIHDAFITKQQKFDDEEEEQEAEEMPAEIVLTRDQLLDVRTIKSQ